MEKEKEKNRKKALLLALFLLTLILFFLVPVLEMQNTDFCKDLGLSSPWQDKSKSTLSLVTSITSNLKVGQFSTNFFKEGDTYFFCIINNTKKCCVNIDNPCSLLAGEDAKKLKNLQLSSEVKNYGFSCQAISLLNLNPPQAIKNIYSSVVGLYRLQGEKLKIGKKNEELYIVLKGLCPGDLYCAKPLNCEDLGLTCEEKNKNWIEINEYTDALKKELQKETFLNSLTYSFHYNKDNYNFYACFEGLKCSNNKLCCKELRDYPCKREGGECYYFDKTWQEITLKNKQYKVKKGEDPPTLYRVETGNCPGPSKIACRYEADPCKQKEGFDWVKEEKLEEDQKKYCFSDLKINVDNIPYICCPTGKKLKESKFKSMTYPTAGGAWGFIGKYYSIISKIIPTLPGEFLSIGKYAKEIQKQDKLIAKTIMEAGKNIDACKGISITAGDVARHFAGKLQKGTKMSDCIKNAMEKGNDNLKEATKKREDLKKKLEDEIKKIRFKWGEWTATALATAWGFFATSHLELADGGAGSCTAEQPLKGIEACKLCNLVPFTCNEARCKALGNCRWVPAEKAKELQYEGLTYAGATEAGLCLPGICTKGPPEIEEINLTFYRDRTTQDLTISNTQINYLKVTQQGTFIVHSKPTNALYVGRAIDLSTAGVHECANIPSNCIAFLISCLGSKLKNLNLDEIESCKQQFNECLDQESSALASCLENLHELSYAIDTLRIYIKLNQHAKCKYDLVRGAAPAPSFEEMRYDFESNELYPLEDTALVDLSQLALGESYTLYIKCEGECGNQTLGDYNYIRFRLEPKPDWLAPRIVFIDPDGTRQYLSGEASNVTVTLYLDENADCYYSTQPQNFTLNIQSGSASCKQDTMCLFGQDLSASLTNNTQCILHSSCKPNQPCYYWDETTQTLREYKDKHDCAICNLTLNLSKDCAKILGQVIDWQELNRTVHVIGEQNATLQAELQRYGVFNAFNQAQFSSGITKLFKLQFRCCDMRGNCQDENESRFWVIATWPPYELQVVQPKSSVFEPYPLNTTIASIKVETSRETLCRIKPFQGLYRNLNGVIGDLTLSQYPFDLMEPLDKAMAKIHEGTVDLSKAGIPTAQTPQVSYTVLIKCRDLGGLEKANLTWFSVQRDIQPPKVTRIFYLKDQNALAIKTDKKAKCYYSLHGCNESINESFIMQQEGLFNFAPWNPSLTYYVKCFNEWSYGPERGCTAIIKPYEVKEATAEFEFELSEWGW